METSKPHSFHVFSRHTTSSASPRALLATPPLEAVQLSWRGHEYLLPGSADMFHLQPWLGSKSTILRLHAYTYKSPRPHCSGKPTIRQFMTTNFSGTTEAVMMAMDAQQLDLCIDGIPVEVDTPRLP